MAAQAAISISTANVQGGVAYIAGKGATLNATVIWEGFTVTKANTRNGGFSFFGVLPDDCTGILVGGTQTAEVRVLGCTPVIAGPPVPVAKTGQPYGVLPGDDGNLQKGVAWPDPRFTDNGNGTVTDNLTGLIWLKDANCLGPLTWADALSAANTLADGTVAGTACSLGDGSVAGNWRLPNRNELTSLLDLGNSSPAVAYDHPFIDFQQHGYWSSTSYAFGLNTLAWFVTFVAIDLTGDVSNDLKTNIKWVIAVRDGS